MTHDASFCRKHNYLLITNEKHGRDTTLTMTVIREELYCA